MAFSGRARRQLHWACAAAIALASVGGCAGDPPDAKPLPKRTVEPTASRAPGPEHGEALTIYRAMWGDLVAVSASPDPRSPLLKKHAMGGALELMRYGLKRSEQEGVVSKGTPRLMPKVVSAADSKVEIRDCVDGANWLQYKRNGELKNDVPGSHFKTDATVRRVDGEWKVASLYMHESGSC
ncbi:hypothetical protein BX264_4586 [Streptomyces sp. 2333.5]|nr:hypothetical protein BX264_4586 [Streptomyces sp. 2333.5]SEE70326.1 hypothetical protein SAMN05428942_4687 [Streptomyces sp. 2112.2]